MIISTSVDEHPSSISLAMNSITGTRTTPMITANMLVQDVQAWRRPGHTQYGNTPIRTLRAFQSRLEDEVASNANHTATRVHNDTGTLQPIRPAFQGLDQVEMPGRSVPFGDVGQAAVPIVCSKPCLSEPFAFPKLTCCLASFRLFLSHAQSSVHDGKPRVYTGGPL
jgi:hypothetical protein